MNTLFLRFAGASTLTTAGVCAVAAYPLFRWGGSDGLISLGIAAGVTLAGALGGFVPLSRAPASDAAACVQAALIGIAIRMFLTLGAVAGIALADLAPHRGAFLIGAAALYVALLAVETRFAARLAAAAGKTAAA